MNNTDKSPAYLLTYDHGGVILWGPEQFKERLHSAVSWLDKYPSFKLGLDNESFAYDCFASEAPEVTEQIRQYLDAYAGRFGIGSCTYGQPLSTFINEESNVRQLVYAIRTNLKHFGCTPPVYIMSEHANHAQIPQLIRGTEYKGAVMRTHFMMYGYNPTYDEAFGWWVGIDGSRIPTVPTYEGEGAAFGVTTLDNWVLTRWPDKTESSLEEYCEKFAHIQPLLASRFDDSGLRCEALVAHCEGDARYQWILAEELMALYPEPSVEFVTLPDDFTVRMPWGYCGNEIFDMCRKAEVRVLTAERLAAMELLLGGTNHQAELEESWKNLLVSQHHDVQICGLLKDSRKYLPKSLELSQGVLDSAMSFVASRMASDGLRQVTVFNPVSWQRRELIRADVAFMAQDAVKRVSVLRDGMVVPSDLVSPVYHADGTVSSATVEFYADLPGLGYAAYGIATDDGCPTCCSDGALLGTDIDADVLTIRTSALQLVLNPSGGVQSIADVTGNTIYVRGEGRSGFFAAMVDDETYESVGSWTIERFGSRVVATERGSIGPIPYEFSMTCSSETSRIDCHVAFTFDGQTIGRKDGGFSHEEKLNFKLHPVHAGEVIGVRDLPFVIAETEATYVEGNYWTAVTDGSTGVALFNRGTMGSVRGEGGSFSIPLAYANNYIWGTRMLSGNFEYEFAIYPFVEGWKEADLHRRALEYNFPAPVAVGNPGDGQFGTELQPVRVASSENVVLSALFPEESGVYARLYEFQGIAGEAELTVAADGASLSEVNLLGNGKQELDGRVAFTPWQIRTLLIASGR